METSLTTWEAKERAGLLALETEKWREKRLIAENPNTTADVLERLADDVRTNQALGRARQIHLLDGAILAHPNTLPNTLFEFLRSCNSPFNRRLFCLNPVVPVLSLEVPDFWVRLHGFVAGDLLCEETLPQPVARALTYHAEVYVVQSAHWHISLAPELPTGAEGSKMLTAFWQDFCLQESKAAHWKEQEHWHTQLVKLGLAPVWALGEAGSDIGRPAYALHKTPPHIRREFIRSIKFQHHKMGAFVQFVNMLNGVHHNDALRKHDQSNQGVWRLHGALKMPLSTKPIRNDIWERCPLDFVRSLSHDGNRFVRWAAQTRFADPDFTFTWHDETGKV